VAVPPVVLGGEFILRHDLAVAAAVLLHIYVLAPSTFDDSDSSSEGQTSVLVLGEHDDDEDDQHSLAPTPPPRSVWGWRAYTIIDRFSINRIFLF